MRMKLLDNFRSPLVTRTIWHSPKDKALWEPRVQQVNAAWPDVERRSILEGLRGCALQPITQAQYLAALPWAMSHGLRVRVVRTCGRWEGFAHHYPPGDDYLVTAFARDEAMLEEPERHLGYPACCQRFFDDSFGGGVVDPMWQWAGGLRDVAASPLSNPLLRYVSLRLSFHIPCGPACPETVGIG